MANVFFKRGLQAALPKTGAEGAFYLTTDTNRLYVCNSDNGPLVELNQSINTVAKMNDLPDGTSIAAKGQYYYITELNALAYHNGSEWVQINPNTNTTYTIGAASITGGAQVNLDASEGEDSNVNIKGAGATSVTVDNGAIVVSSTDNDTKYAMSTAAGSGNKNVKVALSADGTEQNSYEVVAGTNIKVELEGKNIKISADDAANMYNTSASLEFDENGKLTMGVTDGNGTVTDDVTPEIKIGTKDESVMFKNGIADLSVYTMTEIDELIANMVEDSDLENYYTKTEINTELAKKADKNDTYTKTEVDNLLDGLEEDFAQQLQVADALHYCGTVSQEEAAAKLDITKAANGDTYKASSAIDYNGIKANRGDLIIADGTEDEETGLLTTGTWEVITSGDDQVIIGDITGNTYKVKDGTEVLAELALETEGENLKNIEWAASGSKLTGTIKHDGPGADASNIKTGDTYIQDPKSTAIIPVLTDIKYDANGHIIEATQSEYYITDTDTHNNLKEVSIVVPYDPLDEVDDPGKFTITVSMTDGESKSASLEFVSDNLKIASKGSDTIGIDLVWGSF